MGPRQFFERKSEILFDTQSSPTGPVLLPTGPILLLIRSEIAKEPASPTPAPVRVFEEGM
jgi:hypothetical protein